MNEPNDRRRIGLYSAGLGGLLELVGLVWDATRHSHDPGLAAREDLFSADPSHALLIVGVALVAVGLAFEMLSIGLRVRRLRGEAVVVAALLIALLGANAGVAFVTSSTAPTDDHGHAAMAAAALNDPVGKRLSETLKAKGLAAALDELSATASRDPAVNARGHDFAHLLGELAVAQQPDVSKVMKDCRDTFLYGCYHGALKAYFGSKGKTRPSDVVGVCPASLGPLLQFQCLHGLGHGVLSNLEYDLFRALVYCDALSNDFDKRSCYGGVFMENIVVAIDQVGGRATDERAEAKPFLRPDEPLYPCNVVAEKYRWSCYQLQTSGMLLYNGRDFAKTAASCDAAPSTYIPICFESLGRDVSGEFQRDDLKTIATCESLGSPSRAGCFVGAVKNLLDAPDRVLPFCRRVPDHAKSPCYSAAGTQLGLNYPSGDPRRASACVAAEPAFVKSCQETLDKR